jgi:hypothetical protein
MRTNSLILAAIDACPEIPNISIYLDTSFRKRYEQRLLLEVEKHRSCGVLNLARLLHINTQYSSRVKRIVADFLCPGPIPSDRMATKIKALLAEWGVRLFPQAELECAPVPDLNQPMDQGPAKPDGGDAMSDAEVVT